MGLYVGIILCIIILFILHRIKSRKNRKILHKKKIKTLEKKKDYCQLGRLYHHGLAETYQNRRLIQGIPSDPYRAIYNYERAINLGDYECALDLAAIYHWGIAGYNLQNHHKARHLYLKIIEHGTQEQKHIAKDRLQQISARRQQQEFLPEQVAPEPPRARPYVYIGEPTVAAGPVVDHRLQEDNIVDDLLMFFTVEPVNDVPALPVVNDSQNVHDSGVSSSIKQSVQALKEHTKITKSISETRKEIRDYLLALPECDKKRNALKTLNFMEKHNAYIIACDMHELEILQLVWNRIQQSAPKEKMEENLVDELAEAVENDKVVCTTGRYTRLIDSLNFVDPLVKVRPLWVINDEIVKRSGVLFREYFNQLSDNEKNIYENDLEGATEICSKIKSHIRRTLENEYVKSGTLRQELLNAELSKWLDEIC
jgi:hypothetical protein